MDARNIDIYTKGKKDRTTLKNYRPVTLINIAYKRWVIIITNRLTPYMNHLAKETQNSHKTGRSEIGILPIVQNQIQNGETLQLILIGLSKAFGSIGRNILRAVLYEEGIQWEFIKHIKMVHQGNQLCPKYKGFIGHTNYNNDGVFRGGPVGAVLFIIDFDKIMGNSGDNLQNGFKLKRPLIATRDEKAERAWAHQMVIARYREKGARELKN